MRQGSWSIDSKRASQRQIAILYTEVIQFDSIQFLLIVVSLFLVVNASRQASDLLQVTHEEGFVLLREHGWDLLRLQDVKGKQRFVVRF